ncbi:MAG: sopA 1 [Solimicrobium sp.]|jgi:uncharacterized protein YjbI with pentapeptide repeats|nr:sopA 1 [Solimicrobium sp.]
MSINTPPELSSFTSLRTMERLLTNKGANEKKSNVFDSVADYSDKLSMTLSWLLSPLFGLSFTINEIYQFINGRAKEKDAAIVIGEVLFNQSNEEKIRVGKFEISINDAKHVEVRDMVSNDTVNTFRSREDIIKDFETSLAVAINSSTKSAPQAVIKIHAKLLENQSRQKAETHKKMDLIDKLIINPQAKQDLLQFSIADLELLAGDLPHFPSNGSSIMDALDGIETVDWDTTTIQGSDASYSLVNKRGRFFLQEKPSNHVNDASPLKVIELLSARDLVSFWKLEQESMYLKKFDLSEANLENAFLDNSNIKRTSFARANLRGASLDEVSLLGANFKGATFNGNELFTLSLPEEWGGYNLKKNLDHLSNPKTGSILTAIDSIDDSYKAHKLNLMHQLINSFDEQKFDTSEVDDALLDIWMKNPIYFNDSKIIDFLGRKISNSENTDTILKAMDSIDNKYAEEKRNLSHYLINSFNEQGNDYSQASSMALAWLLSPIFEQSLAIKKGYEFINERVRQSDAVIVIGELLFNPSPEEVITTGKFAISINVDNHVVIMDMESREFINTGRPKADIIKDFEEGLVGAIGPKPALQAVTELHRKLVMQKEVETNQKNHLIKNLIITPQAAKDLLQFSLEDLELIASELPDISYSTSEIEDALHQKEDRDWDEKTIQGSDASYSLGIKRGRFYLQEVRTDEMKSDTPLQVIELITASHLVNFIKFVEEGKNLKKLNLAEADLEYAYLSYSNLNQVSFTDANLRGARFKKVTLLGANFRGALFNGDEKFTLDLPEEWDEDDLEDNLDHLNNPETGSILTAIESIDDRYAAHKLSLMHQLIDSLQDADTSDVAEALLDIWLRNPIYFNDQQIRDYIVEIITDSKEPQYLLAVINSVDEKYAEHKLELMAEVLDAFIEQDIDYSDINDELLEIWWKNPLYFEDPAIMDLMKITLLTKIINSENSVLKVSDERELKLLLDHMSSVPDVYFLKENNFFVQLIKLCTEDHISTSLKDQAVTLYEKYLALPELSEGKRHMETNYGDIREKDKDKGLAFIFYKKIGNDSYQLLMEPQQIQKMLASAPDTDWDSIYIVKNSDTISYPNLAEIFSIFELFSSSYQFHLKNGKLIKVLDGINLNYLNENGNPTLLNKNYLPLFEEALQESTLLKNNFKADKYNLTRKKDQDTLKKIFRPLLSKNTYLPINDQVFQEARAISKRHAAAVLTALDLSQAPDDKKARGLFSLAVVVTKLTSDYFFGAELGSPEAIREYAAGLMIKAHQLDPSVYGESKEKQEDNFTDWMKILLGGKDKDGDDVFSCTAVLSGKMFDYANKQTAIKEIMDAGIRPNGWL